MEHSAMTTEERNWGMACHLAALAKFTHVPFAGILGPLVVWLIKREQYPFVNDQGKEALNFQITVSIISIAGIGVMALTVFALGGHGAGMACLLWPVVWGILIADAVFVAVAAVNANKGFRYRYPFAIRFLK